MKAFDVVETVKKHFSRHATGKDPLFFVDADNGDVFEFKGVKHQDNPKLTIVEIELYEESEG